MFTNREVTIGLCGTLLTATINFHLTVVFHLTTAYSSKTLRNVELSWKEIYRSVRNQIGGYRSEPFAARDRHKELAFQGRQAHLTSAVISTV